MTIAAAETSAGLLHAEIASLVPQRADLTLAPTALVPGESPVTVSVKRTVDEHGHRDEPDLLDRGVSRNEQSDLDHAVGSLDEFFGIWL